MSSVDLPDPRAGVFTTALVVEGQVIERDAHLDRLQRSLGSLYGRALPGATGSELDETARPHRLARLRVAAVPEHDDADVEVSFRATPISREIVLPAAAGALALRTVEVQGWRGAHKWNDRRLLEHLDHVTAPYGALLVDPVRGALETTRANLFIVDEHGVVVTPAADGSILPGINRACVVDLARGAGLTVREAPLARGDLVSAREIFTTGSVRGIEPVREVDEISLSAPGPVTTMLAGLLRARWFGQRASR